MPTQVLKRQTKPTESVSRKPYGSRALSRYIFIDGLPVRVYDATDEEFYHYVYDLLQQFYEEELKEEEGLKDDEKIFELRYRETFNLDWSNEENRVAAINQFNAINRARRTCRLPLIALFAE